MPILFKYEQSTGNVYNTSGTCIGTGYSGKGEDKNNPASEGGFARGPIPCGIYSIEGPPYTSSTHGPYVLHLIPDKETKDRILKLGRQPYTFLMHGDSKLAPGTASEGCIIQSRMVREQVWHFASQETDPLLEVVAVYGS